MLEGLKALTRGAMLVAGGGGKASNHAVKDPVLLSI